MPGPAGKRGRVRVRFGPTGKPVEVNAKDAAAARAGKGRLYEDGSFVPKTGQLKGSKAARPNGPNPRAMERANPNASFKRAGPQPGPSRRQGALRLAPAAAKPPPAAALFAARPSSRQGAATRRPSTPDEAPDVGPDPERPKRLLPKPPPKRRSGE